MEETTSQTNSPVTPTPSAGSGCGDWAATIGLGVWAVVAMIAFSGLIGVLEQTLMMNVYPPMDLRWAVVVGYGAAWLLPAGLFWVLSRWNSGLKSLASASGWVALFGLLQSVARLADVVDGQTALALQLGGVVVFLLIKVISGWIRPRASGLGWGLLFGLAMGLPWAVLGALGSAGEVVLALLVGLGFGVAAAWVLAPVLSGEEGKPYGYGAFIREGLLAAALLLGLVQPLGANGTYVMLGMIVPPLGFVVAALLRKSQDGRAASWPALAALMGLTAVWPLAFVDLEELSILLSGMGEATGWAWLAAGVQAAIGAVAVLAALGLMLWWLEKKALVIASWILSGAVGLAFVLVYAIVGQPGFFGEEYFVILKDQADLSEVAGIADPMERRQAVYDRLVAHADVTQDDLKTALERRGLEYRSYYLVNAVQVKGGLLARRWLERRPEVDRVLTATVLRELPAPLVAEGGYLPSPLETPWNLTMIGADKVWKELGVTGEGVVVGQSDSGVDGTLSELSGSFRGRDGDMNYDWFDPWNGSTAPEDRGGHGTHTMGTVLGETVGVAPGAEWIGCVNLGRNLGNPGLYLECMQFNFAPFPLEGDPLRDGEPELGAHVLNNSWGCPTLEGCDPNALVDGVKALRAAGVFVVVSAGNDGQEGCGTVASPLALYDDVFSVAAVDQSGDLASFSSLGPVSVDGSNRMKPDLSAPGVDVLSVLPGGDYAEYSGTSMAGPHMVGVVALMWSANPHLIGEIEATEEILRETAQEYTGWMPECVMPGTPNAAVGYGIVDAYAAVQAAMAWEGE
ncbi:MAG: S8 family serine peptidase [Anaerolineaceae bacterium]|nr:S8 family serine peptidase [Anaerolineaceae bacterium]